MCSSSAPTSVLLLIVVCRQLTCSVDGLCRLSGSRQIHLSILQATAHRHKPNISVQLAYVARMSMRAAEPVAPVTSWDSGEAERTHKRCRNFGWVLRGCLQKMDYMVHEQLVEQLTGHCARTSNVGMHEFDSGFWQSNLIPNLQNLEASHISRDVSLAILQLCILRSICGIGWQWSFESRLLLDCTWANTSKSCTPEHSTWRTLRALPDSRYYKTAAQQHRSILYCSLLQNLRSAAKARS